MHVDCLNEEHSLAPLLSPFLARITHDSWSVNIVRPDQTLHNLRAAN